MARRTDPVPIPTPVRSRAGALLRRTVIAVAASAATIAVAPSVAVANTVEVTPPPIEKPLPMKQTSVRVAVKNTGTKRLTGLSLNVRSAKGVRVRVVGAKKGSRTTRTLKALGAGKTTRVTVRLQRLKGGPQKGAVTVRVQRKKKTIGSQRLEFGVNPNTLAGRYFWGSTFSLSGTAMDTLYFSNDNLVFTDDMEGAYANCAAADEKCRPYQYTAKGNQLVIDGKPAEISGRKLNYDGQTYFEWGVPPAGTRFDANVTYANQSGLCPLYCNFFREDLRFSADGMVVRGSVVSGTGPIVDYGIVPPDRLATYEVRADGTILMAFADGTQRIETIAFYMNDDGTLKPASEGVLLNGDGYFDISD